MYVVLTKYDNTLAPLVSGPFDTIKEAEDNIAHSVWYRAEIVIKVGREQETPTVTIYQLVAVATS